MSSYRYSDVPLTPTVFADLVVDMGLEGVFTRAALIEKVTSRHESSGGLPSTGSAIGVAKKALNDLTKRGVATQAAYGHWRISQQVSAKEIREPVEIGEGKQIVYAYYFPAYRDQAAYLGRDEWPMKIGMTTSELQPRLYDQGATAMPEAPVIGLLYRTNSAANAERMLHSTLRERDRHIAGSPGKEWFMTSIGEIRSILDFATGSPTATG